MSNNKKPKTFSAFVIFLFFFVILFATNPTMDDFTNHIKREMIEYNKEEESAIGIIGNLLSSPVAWVIGQYTHRSNLYVCSIYMVNIDDEEIIYLGILNQFIPL